ncbi:MAG: regulator of protease activity HflC (stomatin/prohibitin superfamily) [Actinomycetes bacterium]|jgi:regulator of protease activity HflC (stomatin/prohibitin superfamily)
MQPAEATNMQAAPPESDAHSVSGVAILGLVVVLLLVAAAGFVAGITADLIALWVVSILIGIAAFVLLTGLYMIAPAQAAVLTLFGDYRGTDRKAGLRFTNPLVASTKISLRVRNFTTTTSKVNDANGNPIHIGAVVVWQVVDTARALFGVDDFSNYVAIQSESAVRQLARSYPYDSFEKSDDETVTLIGDASQVNEALLAELQERADAAGVRVIEARVTDLSYAPEIAEAMLRRQQASAIVAGRAKIVEGSVGMVRQALRDLEEGDDTATSVTLDADRRATFAMNLMTVIASDSPTNPVVNVGSAS